MQFYARTLPAIDPQHPDEALRALEAHIRYLQERTDNAIVQLRRATGLQAENRSAQTAAGAAGKEN